MSDKELELRMAWSRVNDLERELGKVTCALQEIYDNRGEDPLISEAYRSVEIIVAEHKWRAT